MKQWLTLINVTQKRDEEMIEYKWSLNQTVLIGLDGNKAIRLIKICG